MPYNSFFCLGGCNYFKLWKWSVSGLAEMKNKGVPPLPAGFFKMQARPSSYRLKILSSTSSIHCKKNFWNRTTLGVINRFFTKMMTQHFIKSHERWDDFARTTARVTYHDSNIMSNTSFERGGIKLYYAISRFCFEVHLRTEKPTQSLKNTILKS